MNTIEYHPGPAPRTVRTAAGKVLAVPDGWILVPPGDPGLTRRVKAAGEHWPVAERVRRRIQSRGVWAPAATVARIRSDLEAERATEAHARRRERAAERRQEVQAGYVETFREAILRFLDFPWEHTATAERLADRVTRHATPVGSGTVARTERIPVEQRAEAAVIAWMRHQTTGYDDLSIRRVRGERRAVRRSLAAESHALLRHYRSGRPPAPDCPLQAALAGDDATGSPDRPPAQ